MSISTKIKVDDAVRPLSDIPVVHEKTFFKETLETMGNYRLGIACIVDQKGILKGIITDGDIRRMLLKEQKPFSALFAEDSIQFANTQPSVIKVGASLHQAIAVMEKKEIQDLPIVDQDGLLVGILHLHTAIKIALEDR